MWLDEKEFSKIMYDLCLENNKEEYWSHISDSFVAYLYCLNIQDIVEIRNKIKTSTDALLYYINIKKRKEIKKLITQPNDLYCLKFIDDPHFINGDLRDKVIIYT